MKPIPHISAKKYRGLGDVVHALAQPVAKTVDFVLGTDVQNCGTCAQRRDRLNRAVPFKKP